MTRTWPLLAPMFVGLVGMKWELLNNSFTKGKTMQELKLVFCGLMYATFMSALLIATFAVTP